MRSSLLALLITLGLILAGCVTDNEFPADPYTPAPSEGTGPLATGAAAKGILKGAAVRVEKRVGSTWVFHDTATTDEQGQFEVDLSQLSGPVRVILTTDPDTEMVCDVALCRDINGEDYFGQFVRLGDYAEVLGEGFTLEAILPSGKHIEHFSISPLTTLAARWVSSLPGTIDVNAAAVNQALGRVADLFGLEADFYAELPVDITSAEAVQGKANVQAELIGAAFVVLGENGLPLPIQDSLDTIVDSFIQLGGQLGLSQDEQQMLGNSADAIVRRALEVADIVGSAVLLGDTTQLDNIKGSLNGLLERWGTEAVVTSAQGTNVYNSFTEAEQQAFGGSRALFDQLEKYFVAAGVTQEGTFIEKHRQQLNWLYQEEAARADTAGLIGAVGQVAIKAVLGTAVEGLRCVAGLLAEEPPEVPVSCGGNTLTFDESSVSFPEGAAGTVPHHLDVAITLPAFRLASLADLNSQLTDMTFTLKGDNADKASIENATARGELEGELVISLRKGQEGKPGILDLLSSPAVIASEETLLAALMNTELDIHLILDGSLERLSESDQDDLVKQGERFIVQLDASLNANLSAVNLTIEDGVPQFSLSDAVPLLTGVINSGRFETPRGDFLADLSGEDFCGLRNTLKVVVADTSEAQGCFAARLLELPEMHLAFDGQLGGAVGLVNQLISGLMGTEPLTVVLDSLDVANLDLLGDAKLKILDPAEGNKEFAFALNRNRVDVSQKHSDNRVSIYLSSLEGGYLVNGKVWVGTFRFDWPNLGVRIQLADGTDETFALGNVLGALEPELLELVMDSLTTLGLGELLEGISL